MKKSRKPFSERIAGLLAMSFFANQNKKFLKKFFYLIFINILLIFVNIYYFYFKILNI